MFEIKTSDAIGADKTTKITGPCLAASVEVAPGHIENKPHLLKHIPPATRTYIVDLGTKSPAEWGRLCRRVANAGLEPVPHIAACRLVSRSELADRLAAMSNEAGVRDALLIAGEAPSPAGPYASSLDVLESGLLDAHSIRRIGVAGHPQGSPQISDTAIEAALAAKQAFAERTGADMRVVTQFGFEAEAAIRWSRVVQAHGIELPVHLGIAGPASVTSLLKYAAMCGVKASGEFLAKKSAAITSLLTMHSPEQYVRPIEHHVAADTSCPITQFHVFSFGGIAQTATWLCERGSWSADARAVFEQNGVARDLGHPMGNTKVYPQKFG